MKLTKKGFTMTEILAATIIIGVCIFPIMTLFFMNLILLDKAWDLTNVVTYTEDEVEALRNLSFDNIINSNGNIFNTVSPVGDGFITVDDSNPDLLKISVSVRWQDSRTGQYVGPEGTYPIVLETFVARRY